MIIVCIYDIIQIIIIHISIFANLWHLNSERGSKVDNIYYKERQCCFDEHSGICDDNSENLIKYDKAHTCCFFGHRKVVETEELRHTLFAIVNKLITDWQVHMFLFGSKSQFDTLCLKVVSELKEKYSYIKRVFVRAEFPKINDDYREYLLQSYDDTYFPSKIVKAGKASYVERNCGMIDKSSFCVIYYDKNYLPPRRKNSRRDLTEYQPKSGTKLAYEYAERKGLKIINIIDL